MRLFLSKEWNSKCGLAVKTLIVQAAGLAGALSYLKHAYSGADSL